MLKLDNVDASEGIEEETREKESVSRHHRTKLGHLADGFEA